MDYNYHTHTYLCRHAFGTVEEYVQRAIENGIKYMGFSEHAPLRFSDGYESEARLYVDDIGEYFDTVRAVAQKYDGKIEIKIGFEMEYYSDLFDEMLEKVIGYGAEYLILGQHYFIPENIKGSIHTSVKSDSEERLSAYVDSLIEAMDRGVYTYIAHPDVFRFIGSDEIYERHMRRLCRASAEKNVPLEMNFYGIRDHRNYPDPRFWRIAGEEQSPMTFGFDAHTAESAYDGESLDVANEAVKKFNLKYIGKPTIINIQTKSKEK